MVYEFDDLDLELIKKLRGAIEGFKNGDPIRDFVENDELVQAAELLIAVIDAEAD